MWRLVRLKIPWEWRPGICVSSGAKHCFLSIIGPESLLSIEIIVIFWQNGITLSFWNVPRRNKIQSRDHVKHTHVNEALPLHSQSPKPQVIRECHACEDLFPRPRPGESSCHTKATGVHLSEVLRVPSTHPVSMASCPPASPWSLGTSSALPLPEATRFTY